MRYILGLALLVACDEAPEIRVVGGGQIRDRGIEDVQGGDTGGTVDASPDGDTGVVRPTADASGSADLDAGPDAALAQDAALPPDAAPAGDAPLIWRQICFACHGPTGEGTALGYELRHPVREYTTWVVRNGRSSGELPGAMAAYSEDQVSDAQLEEIWNWLDTFPQPVTGEGLFMDYCRNCHGPDGSGGVVGQNIRGEEREEIEEAVRSGEHPGQFTQRREYMPAFGPERLADPEVALIAAWLGAQPGGDDDDDDEDEDEDDDIDEDVDEDADEAAEEAAEGD